MYYPGGRWAFSRWPSARLAQFCNYGHQAVIAFDPEIQMFRGEFVRLNGGADFYAKDVKGLQSEGPISLKVFLEACAQDGVETRKKFSGKFSQASLA
jgi:predicted HicB family RNase H-like nuclease